LTALGLADCSGPRLNGMNDAAQIFSSDIPMARPTGPYDNTANSLGGRYVGSGGDG
jgi:hypothetical protein